MTGNPRDEKITSFVRTALGCSCPDEVFNKIEVSDIDLGHEMTTVTRIVVGDTLLIYILPDIPVEVVADNVGKLVTTGRQDRDSHGYNRFRLVVRSSESKGLEEHVSADFSDLAAGDEKLHIHFVVESALSELF